MPVIDPLDPVRVIILRSVEIEEAEVTLRRAMLATITCTRPATSAEEVIDAVCDMFEDFGPGDDSQFSVANPIIPQ
jgi:hypothetical protein